MEEADYDVEIENGAGVEMAVDEDFEDLYDDVNVGFFPAPEEQEPPPKGEPQQEDHPPQQQPQPSTQPQGGYDFYDDDPIKQPEPQNAVAAPSQIKQPPPQEARIPSPSPVSFKAAAAAAAAPQQEQQLDEPAARPNFAAQASAAPVPPPRSSSAASQDGGRTSIVISELQWWTTDAELEGALAEFGKIKGIKFFEERASGKSKGLCQVDFFEPLPAQLCKENLHGRVFNGRPCVVAYATPQILKQMNMKMGQGGGGGGPLSNPSQPGGGGGGYNAPSQPNQMGKKSSSGRGRGRGRGGGGGDQFGRGGGSDQFGQLPMMGGPYDPSFGPPMRPGMYGMGGFMRGGYPMPFPGVPPHVNPAFFGRGMGSSGGGDHSRGWGVGMQGSGWNGGEEGGERFEEETGDDDGGGGGGGGESGKPSSRDQDSRRRKEDDSRDRSSRDSKDRDYRDRDRDRDRERERERGWDEESYSNKRRHSSRSEH
ncbi:heterogeneous nuclear ribonucleoprotein A3-like [Selaginella moellendorffii]|uniref:heterogeneous nuclear ribonucleoprotein A3-like n=1 Tax=Selaginella moellendorffii TaxID=88036 RepID=UPI000D1C3A30|nr:heterogeneous nuclear ribonucleoprotein A3-like [Selaginella moellendorffii]|eukprot:XP_024527906.1 heterogeneous nuclear ribonucleoprotein A3-like [Selaginella moellendorffii]